RLDAIAPAGRADLVPEYFEPVSVLSLAHVMGLADAVDGPTLARWFNGLAAGVSNYEGDPAKFAFCDQVSAEIDSAVAPLFEAALADASTAEAGDGLISHLGQAVEGPLEHRLRFVLPSLKLVLLGGLQEPAHGGATIAAGLPRHPHQPGARRDRPSTLPRGVRE